MSYEVCGGFGMCTAIIGLLFVREPMREEEYELLVKK
jgi:hypothetical protein